MRVWLDTCVISELRRPNKNPHVSKMIEVIPDCDIFLSVVSIGKIAKGIALLEEGKRKHELSGWLQSLETFFLDRVLSIDAETARIWGEVTALAQNEGKIIAACDGLIAATALQNGLHVMSRNTKDFENTGVLICNPWL